MPHSLPRRMVLLLAALLSTYLVVREGVARASARNPAFLVPALQLNPRDARVQSELAKVAILRAGLNNELKAQSPAAMRSAASYAKQALQKDLTRVDAMAVFGLAAQASGNNKLAAAAMQSSAELSKRNLMTRMWLIQEAGRAGHAVEMLRNIDIALRTSANAQDAMFPLMARVLAEQSSTVPYFIQMLRKDPEWTPAFLYTAIATNRGTVNIARLYRALGKQYSLDGQDLSSLILSTLVAQRNYEEAFRFYGDVARRSNPGGSVTDPSFADGHGLEPFTWRLAATADFDASRSRDPAGKTGLAVTTNGSGAEVVASQLLALPAGRYRFRNTITSDTPLRMASEWRLKCAADDRVVGSVALKNTVDTQWRVPADCTYQWLELNVDAAATTSGESAFVGPIQLTRSE